jgi:hypothetical protein
MPIGNVNIHKEDSHDRTVRPVWRSWVSKQVTLEFTAEELMWCYLMQWENNPRIYPRIIAMVWFSQKLKHKSPIYRLCRWYTQAMLSCGGQLYFSWTHLCWLRSISCNFQIDGSIGWSLVSNIVYMPFYVGPYKKETLWFGQTVHPLWFPPNNVPSIHHQLSLFPIIRLVYKSANARHLTPVE